MVSRHAVFSYSAFQNSGKTSARLKKQIVYNIKYNFVLTYVYNNFILPQTATSVTNPTKAARRNQKRRASMDLLILISPLALILILLFLRQHMLVAALAGGILAMIVGGLGIGAATKIFLGGVGNMLSIVVPVLYAAAAGMVAKAGCFQAVVDLARHYLRGRLAPLAAFMVLVQAMATYMAGMGAGNTMVIAPLVAAAVGAVPQVVAGMAIAAAVCFTTSPASTETVIAAQMAHRDVLDHAAAMMPYTVLFVVIAALIAGYGVWKHGSFVKNDKKRTDDGPINIGRAWLNSIPAVALLIMVVAGSSLNKLAGTALFTPMVAIVLSAALTVLCTRLNATQTCDALVEGSRFILMTLLSVGIFLGFVNMIGEIGTFKALAALADKAPASLTLPVAMIIAFLVAFPAGAFCAGVLTLVLPTLASLNMPSEAMGFVAIATGFGTQISPVQINVAALGEGFDMPIMKVVRNNLPYLISMLALLVIVAVLAV